MLLHRIRHHTQPLHDRIERHPRLAALTNSGLSLSEYTELLKCLYGFYQPLEARLCPFETALPLEDLPLRWKAPLLAQDLDTFGYTKDTLRALPQCKDLPVTDSDGNALGCLYVLEGATLGGNIIRKHLARALDLHADSGAAFYSSYGAQIGSMWNTFCQSLVTYEDRHSSPYDLAQVIESARDTFNSLYQWLNR